jgi:hypothetical protein
MDLDNLLGQNNGNQIKTYKSIDSIKQLKTHYYKVSESGEKIVESFIRLLENNAESFISGKEKSILTDIPISDLRDKFEKELSLPFGRFSVRITYKENEHRFHIAWDSDWLNNNSTSFCQNTFPKLSNYQNQDGFFKGNK